MVLACFLLIADPLYAGKDLWSKNIAHIHLIAWHAAMAVFFLVFGLAAKRQTSNENRRTLLGLFVIGCGGMFAWFGVISWLGVGDFSMVAIAQLTLASVFHLPGILRRAMHTASATAIAFALAVLDESGKFLGELQFVNLLVIVAVAFAIEGFMLKEARALFSEKCRVAHERRRADSVLYNAMPARIANELKYQGRATAHRHDNMGVLFADLVGFTAYAATVRPDEVLRVLNRIYSAFDALADHYRVEKIKTIGDAYMAISADAPHRLTDFALALLRALDEFNRSNALQFALRVGMHIGPTITGVVGSKRLSYDVWGDAVNLASRMEALGEPGRVHVTASVVQALRKSHAFAKRGEIAVKGIGHTHTFYLVPSPTSRVSIQSALPPASGYTP